LRSTLGVVLAQSGRVDEAAQVFDEAVALAPEDAGVLKAAGKHLYMHPGHTELALSRLREATRASPGWELAWRELAIALTETDHFVEAEAAVHRGLELKPGDHTLTRLLGILRMETGDPEAAEGIAREQLAGGVATHDACALNNLGRALWEQGRHEEALSAFEQAVEEDENELPAWGNLVASLHETGRAEEARTHVRSALSAWT
jgi:Flp pilus assembly protein TadD